MTTTPTVALDLATVIALTLVTVSILKGLIEVWVSPAARLHDPLIQLLALLCGVAWSFVLASANGPLSRGASVQAIVSVILGLSGGAGSIGAYHTSTALKDAAGAPQAPPTPAPAAHAERTPTSAPSAPSAPAAAWSSTTVSYAPPAAPVGPAVDASPPEPPQTPTEAPVGPTVTYTPGPPTP